MTIAQRIYVLVLWGIAGFMAVSVVYGLVTGHVFGIGGEHRENLDIVWWSLAENPGYFWFTWGVNLVVGLFFGYVAVRLMRGTA